MREGASEWTHESLIGLFKTPEELLSSAEKQANALRESPLLFEICKTYHVLRYLVAYYEARFEHLPLQVWNEHRMALDHFMRHLVGLTSVEQPFPKDPSDKNSSQLRSMRGHLMRATLDISKFIILNSSDLLGNKLAYWNPLTLVRVQVQEGVSLLAYLLNGRSKAERLFQVAKQMDSVLGVSGKEESEALLRYLAATFEYAHLITTFDRHLPQLEETIASKDFQDAMKMSAVDQASNL